MCGYVSSGLRRAVIASQEGRAERRAHEAGNVFGVAFVRKSGKVSPSSIHRNLPRDRADEEARRVADLNPTATVVVIDCRTNQPVA